MKGHFKDLTSDIIGDKIALCSAVENIDISINSFLLLKPIWPLIMRLLFGPGPKAREKNTLGQTDHKK